MEMVEIVNTNPDHPNHKDPILVTRASFEAVWSKTASPWRLAKKPKTPKEETE